MCCGKLWLIHYQWRNENVYEGTIWWEIHSQCKVLSFLSHDADSALFGQDGRVLVTDLLIEQHVGIPVPPPHIRVWVGCAQTRTYTHTHTQTQTHTKVTLSVPHGKTTCAVVEFHILSKFPFAQRCVLVLVWPSLCRMMYVQSLTLEGRAHLESQFKMCTYKMILWHRNLIESLS